MRPASWVFWTIDFKKSAVVVILIDGDIRPSLEPSVDIGVGFITSNPQRPITLWNEHGQVFEKEWVFSSTPEDADRFG